MKKLFLLLALTFLSAQSFAGSCPDGNEPTKTISADGSYYEYKCADSKQSNNSLGINTYGGRGYISEKESPNYETLRWSLYRKLYYRPLQGYRFYSVKASNPFNFQFDLREDAYIKQQMQTTPLLSYLLYEDGKIVIDEITPKDRFGDMFTDSSMYHSMSMGKSIASYLTGHAICDGTIKSVDSRLDWPILEDTLYHNQKLINLLNMSSGDQAYSQDDESNLSIQSRMANEFKGSKKSYAQYHYTNLNTNIVLSYLLFKYGDADFKQLFDDVFQKKTGIKNEINLNKTANAQKHEQSLGHQFFTTRYDYLRIAKAMLDDWQNDTCVGQYLKTIHERRIPKNGAQGTRGRVGLPLSYGGFFHTGYKGMENRPVMGMDGNGGQTILIDFERGRIVATLAVFDNMRFPEQASFDYKKISYEIIKNGKPASSSIAKKPAEPVIDPQQLILDNEARRESDRKAKVYWDNFYKNTIKGVSGGSSYGSSMSTDDEVLENPYADETAKEDSTKVKTTKIETSDSDPTVSKVIEVTHGDKLIVDIAEPHELAGSNIKVKLKDIDAPDATNSCPAQIKLGTEVKDFVAQKLENASSIKLTNFRKTNTQIIAQVVVDGIDLGDELVSKGYASEEYGYWQPYFCSPIKTFALGNQYLNTDPKTSIFWYERAMVLDPDGTYNSRASFRLFKLYSIIGNAAKSLEHLKKSASLEWVPAMEELGAAYLIGDGVKKDSNQGKKWLKKAFDKGSQRAEDIYCASLPKAKQKTCKF